MVVSPIKLIAPLIVVAPLIVLSAPKEEIPVPEILMASAARLIPPSTIKTAPLEIVVPLLVAPSALACLMVNTPPETVVAPA